MNALSPAMRQWLIVPGMFLAILSAGLAPIASAAEQPNILWISCEDISPQLGCYGDQNATTPHLDQLASESTLFTQAFSCHGVCAPSRTGIITGMYPISLGANHMRSKAVLPPHVKLFPQYLLEAGYYCTNNSKTDYNLHWHPEVTWNENSPAAHWKHRPAPETPFFAVFNLTMTHESKVWPKGWAEVTRSLPDSERHRPDSVAVPPLYPDTPAVRADLARLADLITVMDRKVGQLLRELDEAGLADNTIVMFWSDHGNGLPRAKRWTYDSGSRVPLIVRVPVKLQARFSTAAPGTRDDRMVSLIDLGPTVLNLAGIPVPDFMHGVPLLGPRVTAGRPFIYGARDRLDERFDMVRTVRTRTHRYVRNLMPWRPVLQNVSYGEQNETLREMRRLLSAGELAMELAPLFQAPRPPEELYDLENDPWELRNLADQPQHQATLQALRDECDRWQLEVRDAHLLPEILLDEAEKEHGSRWNVFQGRAGKDRLRHLLQAAKQTSQLDPETADAVATQLHKDPALRWWQLTLLSRAPRPEARAEVLLQEARANPAALRLAAAAGLARAGFIEEATDVFQSLLKSNSPFVRHAAILEIDEAGPAAIDPMRQFLSEAFEEEYCERLARHALNSD